MGKTLYFLKLAGVEGESKSPRHLGEIELATFTWGLKNSVPNGSGGGPGKASISDLTFTKKVDKTSAPLWVASTTGQNLGEGILTIEDLTEMGSLIRSIMFKLTSILVTSFSTDKRGVPVTPTDIISLNCESVKMVIS